jgi:hypothetical protein
MAQTYKSQIMHEFDWPELARSATENAEHTPPDDCGEGCDRDGHTGLAYLGKHWDLFPSGRYYAPWSTTYAWERRKDQAYAMALEAVANKYGGWIESGDGDPTDTYFGLFVPNA